MTQTVADSSSDPRWAVATRSYGVAIYCDRHSEERGLLEAAKIGGYRTEAEGMDHIRDLLAAGQEPCPECEALRDGGTCPECLGGLSPCGGCDRHGYPCACSSA